MSQNEEPGSGHPGRRRSRSALLIALVAALTVEFLLVAAAAVYLLVELLIDTPVSYPAAAAILLLAVLTAVWLALVVVKMLAGQQWTRAAAIVWQVLQASVGVGSLQGSFAQPEFGWPLIVLALAVIVLLFTKPVIAATTQAEDPSD